MPLPFGFYPRAFDEVIGDLRFSTRPGLQDAVNAVAADEGVEKSWVYAPRRATRDFISGKTTESPYSCRVFGLPKTHEVEARANDDVRRLDFVAQCFGFFVGMRMSTSEAGFLDATPIRPGELNDFGLGGAHLCAAVAAADRFWLRHEGSPQVARALTAAIHALFLAQYPPLLQFEEFVYLYTAFDACHTTHCRRLGRDPRQGGHSGRIARLCADLKIPIPPWADPTQGKTFAYRNEALHEGLFYGQPLGFQVMCDPANGNPSLLEMRKLLCRIIVALLGIETDYVRTRIDDRMTHLLSVEARN